MYLISLYFDEKTNTTIQKLVNQVAKETGNGFMVEEHVPPHITISSFDTKREEEVIAILSNISRALQKGPLHWVSVGIFLPHVIFLSPVLNDYLQEMIQKIYEEIVCVDETIMSPFYRPYQWVPHTTIGKKLSKEQLRIAFDVLQEQFVPFKGTVTSIGIAKTNPYQELAVYRLE